MSHSPSGTLGKYQIIREIARSNDIVYEAYDPVMNRRVAVKELAIPRGTTDHGRQERLQRFHREARAAGSLVHPNIVTIYEVAEDSGRDYIAMEYLDGQNLRNALDTKGFLEPRRAVAIAQEVLRGLEFAHSKGVIHRDIKPDNIQLLENGQIKLTDFGIARLTFEPNLTTDGQVFGTPSYMSPEQINGREIDARSDLFSVGVILYEMVAGAKPFQGDNVVAISYAIMNHHPDAPRQANPALWQVIQTALDKSPSLRYRSASEMADALDRVTASFDQVVLDPTAYGVPAPTSVGPPPVQIPPAGFPYGQPYGVGPNATPGMTPYGTPMPSGYGPFGPGQQYGQPYGQPYAPSYGPGSPPTGPMIVPVPVYYPPPARPLLRPETKQFLFRLSIAFALLGTLVAIVIVGLSAVAESAQRPAVVPGPSEPGTHAPRLVAGTASDAARLIARAERTADTVQRQTLWMQASNIWVGILYRDPERYDEAAGAFWAAGRRLIDRGEFAGAREALRQAEGFAIRDPAMQRAIREDLVRAGTG